MFQIHLLESGKSNEIDIYSTTSKNFNMTSPITSRHPFIHFHPVKKNNHHGFSARRPHGFPTISLALSRPRFAPGCFNNSSCAAGKVGEDTSLGIEVRWVYWHQKSKSYRLHGMEYSYTTRPSWQGVKFQNLQEDSGTYM